MPSCTNLDILLLTPPPNPQNLSAYQAIICIFVYKRYNMLYSYTQLIIR